MFMYLDFTHSAHQAGHNGGFQSHTNVHESCTAWKKSCTDFLRTCTYRNTVKKIIFDKNSLSFQVLSIHSTSLLRCPIKLHEIFCWIVHEHSTKIDPCWASPWWTLPQRSAFLKVSDSFGICLIIHEGKLYLVKMVNCSPLI